MSRCVVNLLLFCTRELTCNIDLLQHVYSSMDAGHYVCDYTYYCSLAEAKRSTTKHDKTKYTKVLFMHCPPAYQPLSTQEVTEAVKKVILWVCRGERP